MKEYNIAVRFKTTMNRIVQLCLHEEKTNQMKIRFYFEYREHRWYASSTLTVISLNWSN